MMKKRNSINNFFTDEEKHYPKHEGRQVPKIIKDNKNIVGTKDGKSLELVNCKAYKLIIDDEIYEEKDFKKLFPNLYNSFNIKKTYRNKELKGKTCFEEVLYFYFPILMLQEHCIKVICRKKMLEVTYNL